MDYNDFSTRLKELNLTRSDFAEMVGMSYNSDANWKLKEIPAWVEPFLYHYEKGKNLDEILAIIKKYEQ